MSELRVELVPARTTSELRRAVLRPAWAPGTTMPGDDDPRAVHIAALAGDDVVGAAVLLAKACPHHPEVAAAWQLRGMATSPAHRGMGVGGRVLDTAVDAIGERAGRLVWCKARVVALDFYLAHGFTLDSDEYVEPETGLEHRDMSRDLSGGAVQ